jgi:hypothetical protein
MLSWACHIATQLQHRLRPPRGLPYLLRVINKQTSSPKRKGFSVKSGTPVGMLMARRWYLGFLWRGQGAGRVERPHRRQQGAGLGLAEPGSADESPHRCRKERERERARERERENRNKTVARGVCVCVS